jgi:hypothetical protein
MTRAGLCACLALAAAFVAAPPSRAQQDIPSVDTSQPIPIKKAKPPKPISFKGTVVASNVQAITVRSSKDIKVIQTFSFAPAIRAQAQQMIRQGALQSGARVTVVFQPGTNVAIRIKG